MWSPNLRFALEHTWKSAELAHRMPEARRVLRDTLARTSLSSRTCIHICIYIYVRVNVNTQVNPNISKRTQEYNVNAHAMESMYTRIYIYIYVNVCACDADRFANRLIKGFCFFGEA